MSEKRGKKHEKRFTFSLPDEDMNALKQIADKRDRTTAWIVREAIAKYIAMEGRGEVQLPLGFNQAGDRFHG
jgi:predicted transcriptional regulator